MKKVVYFFLVSVIIFSSCSNKKINELQSKVIVLSEEVKKLELQNSASKNKITILSQKLKPAKFTFCDYEYKGKHKVIEKQVKTRQLPNEEMAEQYTLFPYCVVLVEDAAKDVNDTLWIYVSWQEEIFTLKGWIKESDAVAITKDNIKTAAGAITIRKGALIYKVREFSDIPKSKPELLNEDMLNGTYLGENNNYYYKIYFPVGLEIIVDKKYVEYRVFN